MEKEKQKDIFNKKEPLISRRDLKTIAELLDRKMTREGEQFKKELLLQLL